MTVASARLRELDERGDTEGAMAILDALIELIAAVEAAETVVDDLGRDVPNLWPPHENWQDPTSQLYRALAALAAALTEGDA